MTSDAVVTGMGVICPSGTDLDEFRQNLWDGKIAIERVALPLTDGQQRYSWAGRVRGFDPRKFVDEQVIAGTDLAQQFAIAAASLAKEHAGLGTLDQRRTAVVTGTSTGGQVSLEYAQYALDRHGIDAVPGKTMIRVLPNMAAFQLAARWDLHGPQITISHACATGVDVVGIAAMLVKTGMVDVAIAGGYEASNGFDHGLPDDGFIPAIVAAQSAYGMAPAENVEFASRPFDKNRTGVVTGEGAAFVVVESAEHAAARNARVWASVDGYASLGDAYHPSSPDPSGRWEEEAMRLALDQAELSPEQVDAVIAHGTATRKGDDAEIVAINAVFGDLPIPVPVTSVKGHMGHPGAASGCISIIAGLLAMKESSLPATAGAVDVEDTARFEVVTVKPKKVDIRALLVNAFGFGGQNSAIALRAPAR